MSDTFRAVYKDGAFVPYGRHVRAIREGFKEGEHVFLDVQHERSGSSHRHQFAYINDAFDSLPERYHNAPFAKSAESLRKHALIASGYCEVSTTNVGSHAAAERVSAVIGQLANAAHGYSVIDVTGPLVICKTPMSQSMRAMGKDVFHASKEAVLNWIADLLDVSPDDLRQTDNKEPSQ